jgi:hypothetical protein
MHSGSQIVSKDQTIIAPLKPLLITEPDLLEQSQRFIGLAININTALLTQARAT